MSIGSRITGVGSYVPPKVLTNFDIEEMMDTSDEWIQQRTGIKQRHWVEDDVCTSDLAVEASKRALENAGLTKDDIDMIIFATLSPDHDFPGTGCFLQAKLDMPAISVLDIRQQCSGFLYGLSIADNFIKAGTHKNILLVGAEIHSKGLDKSPEGRNVAVLFGDGAGAVILGADNSGESNIVAGKLHSDGSLYEILNTDGGPSLTGGPGKITMQGKEVFKHAVSKMASAIADIVKDNDLELEDIKLIVPHQANQRILDAVANRLKLPQGTVISTVNMHANTSAASIPLALKEALGNNALKRGDYLVLEALGAGLTWGSLLVKW